MMLYKPEVSFENPTGIIFSRVLYDVTMTLLNNTYLTLFLLTGVSMAAYFSRR